jgi:molybdopterin-guanine dinucleotide biosynthesis protein A
MSQIKRRIATAFLNSKERSLAGCPRHLIMNADKSGGHQQSRAFFERPAATEFAAALIAGGKSRRMGRDKALLTVSWRGRQMPLWKRQLSVLQELKPGQIVLSGPDRPGSPVIAVPDRWEFAGPLAGIATCLEFCQQEYLLVLAVDLPRIGSECLKELLLSSGNGCGVVPVRGGRYEPLAAVYPRQARKSAIARLRRSELRLQDFVQELVSAGLVRSWPVPPRIDDQFTNWNSP